VRIDVDEGNEMGGPEGVGDQQHTSAYASTRQHTSAHDLEGNEMGGPEGLTYADVC
jgi:hypothetical protein